MLSQPLAVPTILADAVDMWVKQPSWTSSPSRYHTEQKDWPPEQAQITELREMINCHLLRHYILGWFVMQQENKIPGEKILSLLPSPCQEYGHVLRWCSHHPASKKKKIYTTDGREKKLEACFLKGIFEQREQPK